MKYYIDIGADIHHNNNLIIQRASFYGRYEAFVFLISSGVDVNIKDDYCLRIASE